MKFDYDLVLGLLRSIENDASASVSYNLDRVSPPTVPTLKRCADAGLITITDGSSVTKNEWWVSLTMRGHDFIALAEAPEVWAKAKAKLAGVGGGSLSLLFDVMDQEVRVMLGIG